MATLPEGEDDRWMHAALTLGRRGFGTTAPNPCVAALVVRDGVLRGRGVTAPGGRPHAEPLALAQAGEAARGATLYVTLEPCCHVGRGRPCVEHVLAAGVRRVVVACRDPDPRVAGQGIAVLEGAGLQVTVGVGERQALRDHAGHVLRIRKGRPAVTLKLAETADGIAAAPAGAPRLMITGAVAGGWVHVARAMHDAVLIGKGTAGDDDPLLTVRLPGFAQRQPLRVVLSRDAALDAGGRLAASAGPEAPVLVLAGPEAEPGRLAALHACGVAVESCPLASNGRLDLAAALHRLGGRGVTRLFCEGGPRLAAALFADDLVDVFDLLTGPDPAPAGGRPALDAASRAALTDGRRFTPVEDRMLGADRLRRFERMERCSPD